MMELTEVMSALVSWPNGVPAFMHAILRYSHLVSLKHFTSSERWAQIRFANFQMENASSAEVRCEMARRSRGSEFAAEVTLLPPYVSVYSHSIVPGGFDVTS
jgi:hypothetical protein